MYPKTDEQGVRWVRAVNQGDETVPAYGCVEVTHEADGILYVRKPVNSAITWGDQSAFCFAGSTGLSKFNSGEVNGVVTFDRPCAAVLDRAADQTTNTFRTEWMTQDRTNNTPRYYAGPIPGSYKLSFGANNWWQVLPRPAPEKVSEPQFCYVLPSGRKTLIPPPVFGYSASIFTAAAGATFGLPFLSKSLAAFWPDSYAYNLAATPSEKLNVTRLVTPYWYGMWQISVSATLWSAPADRGEPLSIGIVNRKRGQSSFTSTPLAIAAREQDLTISAYGDVLRISKENVACQHTQFLYPFTELDIINTSNAEASISDVTISLTALDTAASENDLSDYDTYETTLRTLGL